MAERTDRQMTGTGRVVDVASLSACGPVRRENQDHCFASPETAFFCVADGMGGGQGGAKASEIVCRQLSGVALRSANFAERMSRVDLAVRAAQAEIRSFARAAGFAQMATTVALLALESADSPIAEIASVGDSRIYRFRGGELKQLTRDHTYAEALKRAGAWDELAADAEGAYTHVLTRAIGTGSDALVDWRWIDVRKNDRFLLCTDGVYDMASDDAIGAAFAEGGSSGEVLARLEARVLAAGGRDNYTMIVVSL